jgi:cytochrome c oxidase cbb3-type subunit 4
MFKHYFEGIEYIEVGPIIGLTIFFVFFIVLVYLVVKADSGFISKMENMPLEDGIIEDQDESTSTQT